MPCSSASASSTPIASVGSIGSAMYELINASRPNSVMYHGAPGGDDRSVAAGRVVQAQRADVFDRAVVRRAELPVGACAASEPRTATPRCDWRVGQVGMVVPALDPRVAEGNGEIELQHARHRARSMLTLHKNPRVDTCTGGPSTLSSAWR